jgi:hypothetical protein
MRKNKVGSADWLGAAYHGMALDATTAYPNIAPIEQYLMDRTAEIALAHSAEPESISGDAEVLVLGRRGFETAAKGEKVSCASWSVGWTAASYPDFWNPKVKVPISDNAAAACSYLCASSK